MKFLTALLLAVALPAAAQTYSLPPGWTFQSAPSAAYPSPNPLAPRPAPPRRVVPDPTPRLPTPKPITVPMPKHCTSITVGQTVFTTCS
jgi:hypothetical protein